MNRTEAINILKTLKANCSKYFPEYKALELAIASLKTDDYFESMAEDVEKYTKADFIAMLEEIRLEATKMRDSQVNAGFWEDYDFIVKRRIDKLKGGETDGKREDL